MINLPSRLMLALLGVVSCCSGLLASTTAAETVWRNAEEMRRELQNLVGVTWSAQTLREDLKSLSANQRVAIWLDRRIDPNLEPKFSCANTPLQQILQEVAKSLRSEVGYVGPVVYIGPPSVAAKLWTITELRQEEARRLPVERRNKWTLRRPMQWPELSMPRELLQSVADEAGCKIEGLDAIPHDLWAAANLPPMTLPEQLILMLAGFNRTFEFSDSGRSIRLTTLPERPTLQREYTPRGDTSRFADLARRFPNSNIQRSGSKLAISGTAEDHDAIGRLLRGEPDRRVPTGPTKTVYTVNIINQPLGAVLRDLEVKAQLKVTVDENAQDKLSDLVTFEVKEATMEQLLRAAMHKTGLAFELQGLQLRVSLANK